MSDHVPNMDQPPSGDPKLDELRADIAATRGELQDTVDAIGAKLDVKTQGRRKAAEAREHVADAVARTKQSAPEPVQHAMERIAEQGGPVARGVAAGARPYRMQLALGTGAAVLGVLIVRRRRRRA